ncbi:ABC transporter substrate-binding protein [Cupriavidus necator]|uniref:ABC transporter substrate-binding protein n=1 Tax=Cupriavidus necator TaxID=106590 RepID=A0A1U9UXA2_CUPNE|nr:tripartite tricarboxylate transporter substrate binding protein [Cupriavidus necator]AQV97336.1 ABC transporter substrate-binding protein [Cupriavidus necator]
MADRRQFLKSAASLGAVICAPSVFAQQYPSRPVRIVVPASAGTAVDITARFVAEALAKSLKTPVMVDNRPGAGGLIGTDAVAKAPADGYTLLFAGIPHLTTRWFVEGPVTFDPVKDFVPLAKVSSSALCIVVSADSPYKTLGDLIAAMKRKPGEITFSSGGAGSTSHLCSVMLNDLTRTRAKHIPYKGNGPAVTDVIAGQVDFTSQGAPSVVPMIKAGKLRGLAVTSPGRWSEIPEVPTTAQAGVADYLVSSWIGALAPVATPAPVVERLSDELVRIASSPEFKAFCVRQSMYVDIADRRRFLTELPKEDAHWKRISQLSKES